MQKKVKWIAAVTAVVTALQLPLCVSGAEQPDSDKVQNMTQFYDNWKSRYLTQDSYVTDETQYYVYYSDEHYSGNGSVAVTVSEAHGYGMLITASMAEYDPQAQTLFDGMVRYYQAHTSEIGKHLMAWQQSDNGSALVEEEGADSAADGDMDIAYALLIADAVWGSDGEFNYRDMAISVIQDIMQYEVNHATWTISLGDWTYGEEAGSQYYGATRSSDFILQYLPVFAEVTGDGNWMKVYDSTYTIINQIVDQYQTGLLPDFLIPDEEGSYVPAPAEFLEDVTDGQYAYNSCRTPWRIGMDYLINGNETAKKCLDAMNAFILKETGGDPWNIQAGYTLNGQATQDYNDLCFTAPFLIAAKCGDNQAWETSLRDCILEYGNDVYYGDTIKMLCLIADADAWIVPGDSPEHTDTTTETTMETTTETTEIQQNTAGDINEDGETTLADMVLLLQYLLGNASLSQEQTVRSDLHQNGVVNGMDLAALRQILV